MAEQLLDHAQIGAALEQVGGARMAERVRVQIGTTCAEHAVAAHELLHGANRQPATTARHEHGARQVRPLFRPKRAAAGEVFAEGFARAATDGNHAFFVALAEHAQLLRVESQVLQIEPHELADA